MADRVRIVVGVPSHDGRLDTETAASLLAEQVAALAAGHLLEVRFLPGCSLLHHARNQIACDFLAGECDKLVFVDSDVNEWEPGALTRLALKPVDVAGAAYRFKTVAEEYPVQWLEAEELWADPETGLLEVQSLPTGFLSISRGALERLKEAAPQHAYHAHDRPYYAFFQMPIAGGEMFGEDSWFCHSWREIGGKVWLDPEIGLTHRGRFAFKGHIGHWLRNR